MPCLHRTNLPFVETRSSPLKQTTTREKPPNAHVHASTKNPSDKRLCIARRNPILNHLPHQQRLRLHRRHCLGADGAREKPEVGAGAHVAHAHVDVGGERVVRVVEGRCEVVLAVVVVPGKVFVDGADGVFLV
jgi:hypothetical protein